ncbi:MAG TPA: efflux RND transporter periplasmic adaptor subunit [Polyangiales bacterium]|nr:efflux RND transporter periplasmic adaptor subunit [Polyangiales bacterium]
MTRSFTSLVMLCASLAMACDSHGEAQAARPTLAPALSVTTQAVAPRALPRTLELTGTLIANRESAVAADSAGKVAAVNVERGSRVRTGAPLVEIDRDRARLLADEARADIASARTRHALAAQECTRAERLLELGALQQAEYDRRKAECQNAAIGVNTADIRAEIASKNLSDAVVRAPFDGIVAERFVNPGEYVRADSKVVSIVQLDPLRLELSVPEEALAAFGHGAEVRFRVAAWPGEVFTGRVRYLGATVRRSTRDMLIEAVVPNPEQRLRPGMFAVAQVVLGEIELPVVPQGALRGDDASGGERVFVVQDGHAFERLVQTGPAGDGFVAIRAGLTAGERIVLSPTPELRDGVAVQ